MPRKAGSAVSRHVLPSGMTILVETLPYVRSVALGYYLRSGSAVESEEHGGASHFLEHLVFKGTEKRTTAEIAKVIDILGGDVDALTGKEYTSFYAHVLDEQLDTALDLLTELVGSPRFPQQGIERYAAALFNSILGGGMSSRLFQRIREKEGLVYTVMSYHNGYLHGGYEAVYAACVPKNLKRVLNLTLEEMRDIKL